MNEERMERICALLCLLSDLERRDGDPPAFDRRHVRRMLQSGALCGLVLNENREIPKRQFQRAQRLLARASAIAKRVEHYMTQGFEILLEDDARWPQHLAKLGEEMPLYLFAKGNLALLRDRKASIAGSRSISAGTREKTAAIGLALARRGMTIVSGGARGTDSAAVHAAIKAGGSAIVIPAVPDEEFFRMPIHQSACGEGRFLLLCETPPDEPFSAKKALTRNHAIYALGDVAMVVASRFRRGGSWAGAQACLKNGWSPLYILDEEGREFEGNAALIALGALRMQIVSDAGRDELLLQGMEAAEIGKIKPEGHAPVIVRVPVKIDAIPRRETLRYLGWQGQELDDKTAAQMEAAEKAALACIEPAAVIGEFTLEDGWRLDGANFSAKGEAAALLLEGCTHAVLMAATLGAASERQLLRAQATDAAQATVLDAVLSAAIEAVADRVSEMIAVRAKGRARETTGRFSPGYGDMPMTQTREICAILDSARRIGLTVSASGVMMPRKSVCAIIGEGENAGKNARAGCAFCALRENCRKKKTSPCACAQRRGE